MKTYKRDELNELIDIELTEIYRTLKNERTKLFKLKNGSFAIYESGSSIYESKSQRNCKIEFILKVQNKKSSKIDDIFGDIFGKGFK